MSAFYVTTPIYYVNDLPHIGHVYTTVVADVVARWHRQKGETVRFLTGTDEHGQKIERAAAAAGLRPIELADRVVARYHTLWADLGISHDDFIRTSEERHERGVAEMVRRIAAAGDFYVARHEGWYCTACETFYTEKELAAGNLCPTHERPVEWQAEDNVFFRLSRYQQPLLDWLDRHPEAVRPESRRNEVRSFVASGLKDLSVSRSAVEWGVPFPGHAGHTVYVWLDALTNYVSALGFGAGDAELFARHWQDEEATAVHLVGKDILRFHAVFWPAFLMSAGLRLPSTVWAHGFWLANEKKISKSAGRVPRPDAVLERLGADPLRYFLLREMTFGHDAGYSDEAVVERYNSDLANGLGNTLSRLVTLSRRAFGGRTSPVGGDSLLATAGTRAVGELTAAMDDYAFSRGLEAVWRLLDETNQYLVENEPWKLIKSPGGLERAGEVLWNGLEAVRLAAASLRPVMPTTADAVLTAVGAAGRVDLVWGVLPKEATLPEPQSLFPRVDRDEFFAAELAGRGDDESTPPTAPPPIAGQTSAEDEEKAGMITIDDFMGVELRVATVLEATEVPKSSKLVQLRVDLGDEQRTVVAGIRKVYEPADLVGRQVVVVANLQPAQLMGITSQGMVLAAAEDGAPVLLAPERAVAAGTRVR